jgi:hypothetical protein
MIKSKSPDKEERMVGIIKLALWFLAGVISAVLLFELFFAR